MSFTVAAFTVDDTLRMAAARHIREVVFCREQGVSAEEEWDGEDPVCEHFLLMEDETPIGTARIRPYAPEIFKPGIFKIERVAVLKAHRGRGAGKVIMDHLMTRLRSARAGSVVLNAQCAVEGFYRRLGFVAEGDVFMEADIPHIHMVWRGKG